MGEGVLAAFKALSQKISIGFLILALLGMLTIADGWASPPKVSKTLGNAEKIYAVGVAGEPVRNPARGTFQETTRKPAVEAAVFQEMIQFSEANLDQSVIYAWVRVPLSVSENWPEEDFPNLTARCRQKIMASIQGQNHATLPYSADAYLIETKQGELIKISTTASGYLLVEVSQITSVERAVLLRQMVTQALETTQTDVLLARLESDSIVTDSINSADIESNAIKSNAIKSDAIKSDGIGLEGIGSEEIEAFPVKSSLNFTLSRSGCLTQAEQLQLIQRMLTAAGAGGSQGLNSRELISLTAYSPYLDGFETLAGEPVNLQMASRYHSLDNRTYFQIGAPLLMIEY